MCSSLSPLHLPVSLPVSFIPSSRLPAICISQDAFFYSLVYDPQQKTLLADKGEIRVGNKFQADITDLLKEGIIRNDSLFLINIVFKFFFLVRKVY